jgi:excisionase family DNA binding protein
MDTHISTHDAIEPVLSLTELAAHLSVSAQTLYDLRSKGRGPRGFGVGRELRFRRSAVDAWLARMEASDAQRHDPGEHDDPRPAENRHRDVRADPRR